MLVIFRNFYSKKQNIMFYTKSIIFNTKNQKSLLTEMQEMAVKKQERETLTVNWTFFRIYLKMAFGRQFVQFFRNII